MIRIMMMMLTEARPASMMVDGRMVAGLANGLAGDF
jgi:hypothetical protein